MVPPGKEETHTHRGIILEPPGWYGTVAAGLTFATLQGACKFTTAQSPYISKIITFMLLTHSRHVFPPRGLFPSPILIFTVLMVCS